MYTEDREKFWGEGDDNNSNVSTKINVNVFKINEI
jgi:hypothetical protein